MMAENWMQNLVNAQMEVNRAVWKANRLLAGDKDEKGMEYIRKHVSEAINDLTASVKELDQKQNHD